MFHWLHEVSHATPAHGRRPVIQELSLSMKNNLEALRLACTYISSPYEQKASSNQWISLIFHEHSKSSAILKEELDFMMCIFMSQAIIQLKVSEL